MSKAASVPHRKLESIQMMSGLATTRGIVDNGGSGRGVVGLKEIDEELEWPMRRVQSGDDADDDNHRRDDDDQVEENDDEDDDDDDDDDNEYNDDDDDGDDDDEDEDEYEPCSKKIMPSLFAWFLLISASSAYFTLVYVLS